MSHVPGLRARIRLCQDEEAKCLDQTGATTIETVPPTFELGA